MAFDQEPLKTDLLAIRVLTYVDHDLLPHDMPEDQVYKPINMRIAALSYAHARIDRVNSSETFNLQVVKPAGDAGDSEGEILSKFWQFFNARRPRLVTFHGRGYLIPMLIQRSMIYGLQAPAWFKSDKWTGYNARYSSVAHCDVEDQMTGNGAGKALGFEEACRAIGLPTPYMVKSDKTYEMLAMGQESDVHGMADCDVLSVHLLYLRWMLLAGHVSVAQHDASVDSVVAYLSANGASRPYLASYLQAWHASTRPNPMRIAPPPLAAAAQ